MPDQVSIELKHLVRVCLNDPELRAEIFAGIDEGPMPVRTPFAHVNDGDDVYSAIVKTDREKSPGEPGFIARDGIGWIAGRFTEVVHTHHEASTMSAEQVASQMGMTVDEMKDKLK